MSIRAVRLIVVAVCVGGVAGMIVSSIVDNNDAAVTFGLITAAAVLCSIVATAVANAGPGAAGPVDETQAALVERLVEDLVEGGADEAEVRNLVRHAVRLGRGIGAGDTT